MKTLFIVYHIKFTLMFILYHCGVSLTIFISLLNNFNNMLYYRRKNSAFINPIDESISSNDYSLIFIDKLVSSTD